MLLDRFMEGKNGRLGSVKKELEFLVVHLERIQCTRTVNP